MKTKLIGLLTICRKAGRMVMGFDPVKDALSGGKAKIILLAADLSPRTEKEVNFYAAKSSVQVLKTECTQEDFYFGIGKKVGVIAICDDGFSLKAQQLLSGNTASN